MIGQNSTPITSASPNPPFSSGQQYIAIYDDDQTSASAGQVIGFEIATVTLIGSDEIALTVSGIDESLLICGDIKIVERSFATENASANLLLESTQMVPPGFNAARAMQRQRIAEFLDRVCTQSSGTYGKMPFMHTSAVFGQPQSLQQQLDSRCNCQP